MNFLRTSLFTGLCWVALAAGSANAQRSEPDLSGTWRFVAMIFDGQRMPPRDARLDLKYTFDAQGLSRLAWSYDQWQTLCERRGRYAVELHDDGTTVRDEVTWVNGDNRSDCASDPDMQVGRVTRAPFRLSDDGKLQIDIAMSGQWLTYEWQRETATPATPAKAGLFRD